MERTLTATGLTMPGAMYAKSYAVKPRPPTAKMSPATWYNHFTTRGHVGPVTCIATNADSSIVVTGGVDFSVRVWWHCPVHDAYRLVVVLNVDVPADQLEHAKEALKFCNRLNGMLVPTPIDWERKTPHGVTAVRPLCVKDPKTNMFRNGPILCGTGHGSLHVLDMSELPQKAPTVKMWRDVHSGAINGICEIVKKIEGGVVEFVVVTVSNDKTSCMFRLTTSATQRPTLIPTHKMENSFIYRWFLGGGGRREIAEELATRQDYHEKTCLRFESMVPDGEPKKWNDPVNYVMGLRAEAEDYLVVLAGLTKDGLHLLNMHGKVLHILRANSKRAKHLNSETGEIEYREVKCHTHHNVELSITNKKEERDGKIIYKEQVLIFVLGQGTLGEKEDHGFIAVWGLEDGVLGRLDPSGRLVFPAAKDSVADGAHVEPFCVYEDHIFEGSFGDHFEVDKSGPTCSFAVRLMPDRVTASVRRWAMASMAQMVVQPEHPANMLVNPGEDKTLLTWSHKSPVCSFHVHDDNGAALFSACENGCVYRFDLQGVDKGQVYDELRSLTMSELVVPPLVLLITSLQLLEFAFGPPLASDKDKDAPYYATSVQHVTVCGVDLYERFGYSFLQYSIEEMFWPKAKAVLYIMAFYVAIVIAGLDEVMDGLVSKAIDASCFTSRQAKRLVVSAARAAQGIVYLFIQLCSTVLVVPMLKILAGSFGCVEHGGELVVRSAPDLVCLGGAHLKLLFVTLLIAPCFLFLLVPFATVAGDASFVPSECVFEWKAWEKNNPWKQAAARKATTMHLAFMSRTPKFAFLTLFVELVGKIMTPIGAELLITKPMAQMMLVATTNFVMWFTTVLYAPYVDHRFCVFVQDIKLMIFLASLTGIYTVALNDPDSSAPTIALIAVVGLVLLGLIVKMCSVDTERPVAVRVDAIVDSPERRGDAKNNGIERSPLLGA
mmetsp:Transcript_47595/g.136897  ORF Transcript_47595/g.136897 Transcript_47595/m.136897 type:complete len:946 (+) Transcript_47595:67-2904(+)